MQNTYPFCLRLWVQKKRRKFGVSLNKVYEGDKLGGRSEEKNFCTEGY